MAVPLPLLLPSVPVIVWLRLKYETRVRKKGIIPQTDDWPDRSKFWLFAHGAVLDPDTRLIVAQGKWKKRITRVVKKLVDAIGLVRQGKYVPDREDDELSLALGNKEHWDDVKAEEAGLVFLKGFRRTLQLIENIAEVRRGRRRGLLH